MKSLRLIPYQSEDQSACLAILMSNLDRYFSPGDVADFLRFLADLPGFYGVVEQHGRVVASGGVAVVEGEAALTWGMVYADAHGKGIGRFLTYERLRRLLAEPSVHVVRMNTSQETLGFYLKMGFVVSSHRTDGYRPGLDRYDLVLTWNDESKQRLFGET